MVALRRVIILYGLKSRVVGKFWQKRAQSPQIGVSRRAVDGEIKQSGIFRNARAWTVKRFRRRNDRSLSRLSINHAPFVQDRKSAGNRGQINICHARYFALRRQPIPGNQALCSNQRQDLIGELAVDRHITARCL